MTITSSSSLGSYEGGGGLEPQLSEVNHLYFNEKVVHLDGYKFISCRFDRCELVVHTPYFILEQCVIDASCSIVYGKDVSRIIKLFNSRSDWAYNMYPGLVPEQHPNGTISIKE